MKKTEIKMKDMEILQASILGTQAFNNGIKRVPFHDNNLMKMLANKNFDKTKPDEATSIEIMTAWSKSWDAANLSQPYN